MAVTYIARYNLANNTAFRQRLTVALAATALAVASEATNTANHAERLSLGNRVLLLPEQYVGDFAMAISASMAEGGISAADETVPTLASTFTDADMLSACASVWNAFALS
jgi:hypothetical protein